MAFTNNNLDLKGLISTRSLVAHLELGLNLGLVFGFTGLCSDAIIRPES